MNKYYDMIPKHGIATLLFALDRFEQNEMFEECKEIIESIEKHEKLLGISFDKRLTPEYIISLQKQLPTWTLEEIVTRYFHNSTLLISQVWLENILVKP